MVLRDSGLNWPRFHFKMVVGAHQRSHHSYKIAYTPTIVKRPRRTWKISPNAWKPEKWWRSTDRWSWTEAAYNPVSLRGLLPRSETTDLPRKTPKRLQTQKMQVQYGTEMRKRIDRRRLIEKSKCQQLFLPWLIPVFRRNNKQYIDPPSKK